MPQILLPLGISFFTFQQIAFLIDCYKRKSVEILDKNHKIDFIDYALFISFFPQLIAGPIVHHKEMMPQFSNLLKHKAKLINYELFAKGAFIFSLGLFKKVFIADSFAIWADLGFAAAKNNISLNIFEAWISSLSYTFQIYFDFSGYCDMAIGLGLFFGIFLPLNFNSPYKALNITDFWRKWHITLGRFLKDYLYIPLGGNRVKFVLNLRNLFIVAFLSGVWHGAGWGFVIWGILHGLAMITHRVYQAYKPNLRFFESRFYKVLAWFVTFNFLNLTWIFFRSENLNQAFNLISYMFSLNLPESFKNMRRILMQIGGSNETLWYIILSFFITLYFKNSFERLMNFKPNFVFLISTALLFYISVFTLFSIPYSAFIYFNF